jgi:hypothetical protein
MRSNFEQSMLTNLITRAARRTYTILVSVLSRIERAFANSFFPSPSNVKFPISDSIVDSSFWKTGGI